MSNNAMNDMVRQLVLRASNAILELTDGITAKRTINVNRALEEAHATRQELLVMWGQLGSGQGVESLGPPVGGAPQTEVDDPRLPRLPFLGWLMGLKPLKPMGKCRVNPDTDKFQLVFQWDERVYDVSGELVTLNASEEFQAPPWMVDAMGDLKAFYRHGTWSFVSTGHFLQLAGPAIRGSR